MRDCGGISREIFERGDIVAPVCHGYCGLLNTTLSDGSYLVAGRELTGFAWPEEVLARVDWLVPCNAEEAVGARGAYCSKARLPFVCYTVVDGNLVTVRTRGRPRRPRRKVAALLSGRSVG